MDLLILNPSIQEFIQKQIGISVAKLALQKNPFPEVEWIAILNQIEAKTKEKGFTIVPLRIFFNDKHYAKMEIGIGRGKKEYDKRETIKNRDIDKDIKRYLAK